MNTSKPLNAQLSPEEREISLLGMVFCNTANAIISKPHHASATGARYQPASAYARVAHYYLARAEEMKPAAACREAYQTAVNLKVQVIAMAAGSAGDA